MTVKAKITAINKLLSDIYQQQMRLSYLLAEMNFSEEDIKFIANQLLEKTVDNFLNTLQTTILAYSDGERSFNILQYIYGLEGNAPRTLESISYELEISRERVRQIKNKVLKKIRVNNNKLEWQNKFKYLTNQSLQQHLNSKNNNSYIIAQDSHLSILDNKWFFKIHQSELGDKYITISSHEETNYSKQIIITEDSVREFYNDLMQTINLLGWKHNLNIQKTYSIEDIKQEYSKAYERWTKEEEETLIDKFDSGLTIKEIAEILERQPGAINSRLKKLGLK